MGILAEQRRQSELELQRSQEWRERQAEKEDRWREEEAKRSIAALAAEGKRSQDSLDQSNKLHLDSAKQSHRHHLMNLIVFGLLMVATQAAITYVTVQAAKQAQQSGKSEPTQD